MNERLKLTTYFGERDRCGDRFLGDALFDVYEDVGVRSSILLRGAQGFGLTHHLRTDRRLTLSEDLPLVSIAVDEADRIERAHIEATSLMGSGLVTLEHVDLPQSDGGGSSRLIVQLGRRERAGGRPAFVAVCSLLHRRGIAGATALLGVDGTLRGRRERARFFGRNFDVPMMVVAVGASDEIADIVPELHELLHDPLLTVEGIRVCKRDGERLAGPGPEALEAERWRKLTLYTSESALHGREPIHAQLIGRLRGAGARGATSLRGVWGYHGDHAPHGDRLTQLRRRVPIVTSVIDTAERMPGWYAIADELTTETGLVTIENVPAASAFSHGHRVGGLPTGE